MTPMPEAPELTGIVWLLCAIVAPGALATIFARPRRRKPKPGGFIRRYEEYRAGIGGQK